MNEFVYHQCEGLTEAENKVIERACGVSATMSTPTHVRTVLHNLMLQEFHGYKPE